LKLQHGYGFIHYPFNEEGIRSAITAMNSLHQVTIDRVTYDCSMSHVLEEYFKIVDPQPDNSLPLEMQEKNFVPSNMLQPAPGPVPTVVIANQPLSSLPGPPGSSSFPSFPGASTSGGGSSHSHGALSSANNSFPSYGSGHSFTSFPPAVNTSSSSFPPPASATTPSPTNQIQQQQQQLPPQVAQGPDVKLVVKMSPEQYDAWLASQQKTVTMTPEQYAAWMASQQPQQQQQSPSPPQQPQPQQKPQTHHQPFNSYHSNNNNANTSSSSYQIIPPSAPAHTSGHSSHHNHHHHHSHMGPSPFPGGQFNNDNRDNLMQRGPQLSTYQQQLPQQQQQQSSRFAYNFPAPVQSAMTIESFADGKGETRDNSGNSSAYDYYSSYTRNSRGGSSSMNDD
jgi:hypothetical protein